MILINMITFNDVSGIGCENINACLNLVIRAENKGQQNKYCMVQNALDLHLCRKISKHASQVWTMRKIEEEELIDSPVTNYLPLHHTNLHTSHLIFKIFNSDKMARYTTILSIGIAAECLKTIYRFILLSMPCYQ